MPDGSKLRKSFAIDGSKQTDITTTTSRTFELPSIYTGRAYKIIYKSQQYNSNNGYYLEFVIAFAGSGVQLKTIASIGDASYSYESGVVTVTTPTNASYGTFLCINLY